MEHPLPKLLEKTAVALNELIDYLIEMNGLKWTIRFLIENCGWKVKEFDEMQFSRLDVDEVFTELWEEDDDVECIEEGWTNENKDN